MRAFRSLFALLVGAQVGYSFLPPRHHTAATRSIVVLMLVAAGAEAVDSRGVRRGATLLLGAGGTGFAVELAGVATGVRSATTTTATSSARGSPACPCSLARPGR